MSSLPRTALLAVLFAASACKSPTDSPPVPGPPTRITRVSEPASAVVNQVIPVSVRVTDQRGIPVPDVFVKWIAGDGSGVTATAPHPTDADGVARADWFIGPTARRYTLSAHVIEGEGSAQRSVAVTTFSVLATEPAPN